MLTIYSDVLPAQSTAPLTLHSLSEAQTSDLDEVHAMLADGKIKQAEALLRSYLATHMASADGYYLLGYTLFRQNRPKESLQQYTHAAQLRPPTALDLKYVALNYVLLNDYPDADKWLSQSVAWNDQDSDAWYSLGRIRYTENRFQSSIDCFHKALALEPQSVRAENNLGLAYEGLNRTEDAIAAYRRAISWEKLPEPQAEQPYLNLGILLSNQGKAEEALSLLLKAQELAPQDPKIHGQLGQLYARLGDLKQAQTQFEQAVAALPNNAALHFQLGQVYRKAGNHAREKEELEIAAKLNGTHSSPENQ
ncbi:MAG: tetratricopeptide repeat protein [Acidobacteriaceae bacterium]